MPNNIMSNEQLDILRRNRNEIDSEKAVRLLNWLAEMNHPGGNTAPKWDASRKDMRWEFRALITEILEKKIKFAKNEEVRKVIIQYKVSLFKWIDELIASREICTRQEAQELRIDIVKAIGKIGLFYSFPEPDPAKRKARDLAKLAELKQSGCLFFQALPSSAESPSEPDLATRSIE